MALTQADFIGGLLGFIFTIALLSYLLGDNPVYRLALHLFIGVSIGYVALITIYQVLIPRMVLPLRGVTDPQQAVILLVPLVLFAFLVMKLNPDTSRLGNIGVGFLLGVGIGTAVGGAITGTLFPQVQAAWLPLRPGPALINNLVLLIGTVTALLSFQYMARVNARTGAVERSLPMQVVTGIGQGFVVITLAVIYSGLILSGLAILIGRFAALSSFVSGLL
jgi:hypothetical protein